MPGVVHFTMELRSNRTPANTVPVRSHSTIAVIRQRRSGQPRPGQVALDELRLVHPRADEGCAGQIAFDEVHPAEVGAFQIGAGQSAMNEIRLPPASRRADRRRLKSTWSKLADRNEQPARSTPANDTLLTSSPSSTSFASSSAVTPRPPSAAHRPADSASGCGTCRRAAFPRPAWRAAGWPRRPTRPSGRRRADRPGTGRPWRNRASRRSACRRSARNQPAAVAARQLQQGIGQIGPGEIRPLDDRAVEIGAAQVGLSQIGLGQVGARQMGAQQRTLLHEHGFAQPRVLQDGCRRDCIAGTPPVPGSRRSDRRPADCIR